MDLASRKDALPSVVLGHSGVALVNGEKGVGTDLDDVVLEVDGSHELEGVALPLMEARRKQDGLAPVHGEPNVPLLHGQDGTVAVLNESALVLPEYTDGGSLRVNVHIADVVHPGSSEKVAAVVVAELEDVASGNQVLLVEEIIREEAAERELDQVPQATIQIGHLVGVRLEEIQVLERFLSVIQDQEVRLEDCSVRRAVLEEVSVQMSIALVVVIQQAYLDVG